MREGEAGGEGGGAQRRVEETGGMEIEIVGGPAEMLEAGLARQSRKKMGYRKDREMSEGKACPAAVELC